jgi:hypothetical protein
MSSDRFFKTLGAALTNLVGEPARSSRPRIEPVLVSNTHTPRNGVAAEPRGLATEPALRPVRSIARE